jgi:hypothetical protein
MDENVFLFFQERVALQRTTKKNKRFLTPFKPKQNQPTTAHFVLFGSVDCHFQILMDVQHHQQQQQQQQSTPFEEEPQVVRELTATDHVNKQLLEKFKQHLEVEIISTKRNFFSHSTLLKKSNWISIIFVT